MEAFGSPPLAYFLTWATYGTWLPGDDRGWTRRGHGWQAPDLARVRRCRESMREVPCRLDMRQRLLVEATITRHCQVRNWSLHAVSCRSNHVHVVVSAPVHPDEVRNQLKSWCTRRLKEDQAQRFATGLGQPTQVRGRWWGEGCSKRYINDEAGLEAAILYVRDAQDLPHELR
ncbi:MAG: transposase [Planctomycetaceae bacterium]|nr:transposase [Planctomycetaceae bacterium]